MQIDPKAIWQSRTVWLGAIVAVCGYLSTQTNPDGTPLISADATHWLLLASGIATILLRLDTTQPIKT